MAIDLLQFRLNSSNVVIVIKMYSIIMQFPLYTNRVCILSDVRGSYLQLRRDADRRSGVEHVDILLFTQNRKYTYKS